MKKKVISIFMAVLMLTAIVSMSVFSAFAEGEKSGACGKNLTWVLDDNGTLTISGTGKMDDYSYFGDSPWYLYTDSIYSVIIENGVTSIGEYAFCKCMDLNEISLPDTITKIGINAFESTGYFKNSSNWKNNSLYIGKYLIECRLSSSGDFNIKNGTIVIADGAFPATFYMSSIAIPKSVEYIGEYIFCDCENLKDVYYGGSKKAWENVSVSDGNEQLSSVKMHYNNQNNVVILFVAFLVLVIGSVIFTIMFSLEKNKSTQDIDNGRKININLRKDDIKTKKMKSVFKLCISAGILILIFAIAEIVLTIISGRKMSMSIANVLYILDIIIEVAFCIIFAIYVKSEKQNNLLLFISMGLLTIFNLNDIYSLINSMMKTNVITNVNLESRIHKIVTLSGNGIILLIYVASIVFAITLIGSIVKESKKSIKKIAIVYAVISFIIYGYEFVSGAIVELLIDINSTKLVLLTDIFYHCLIAADIIIVVAVLIFYCKCVDNKEEDIQLEPAEQPQVEE